MRALPIGAIKNADALTVVNVIDEMSEAHNLGVTDFGHGKSLQKLHLKYFSSEVGLDLVSQTILPFVVWLNRLSKPTY